MAKVEFEGVWKRFPDGTEAVKDLSLSIDDGEFVILVGPSGCGKSTALRMVAGLEEISGGKLYIGEQVVNDLSPKERDIAMVFQSYALYPHMSVADNMGFALKLAKTSKDEIDRRVKEAADVLGLTEYLHRKPKALSGGQRQRVAMGRAIVREPQVFLMDEPLSNLDAKLRVSTRTQIAALQRRLGVTTVYVTHDQVEAMTMGDRVCVLKDGQLMQCDTPRALYDQPANVFVAGFIGSPAMNIGDFRIADGEAHLGHARIPLSRATLEAAAGEGDGPPETITLGFRPEALEVVPQQEEQAFEVVVNLVEELGSEAYLYGSLTDPSGADMESQIIIARVDPRRVPAKGDQVYLRIQTGQQHVFSAATGQRLPS
jgi:multiple sugar transport system ATP-binding protein